MNHLDEVQRWLRGSGLAGIVIPSTDEYLSEFAPPANRRLRWVTGFRGSVGVAIVLQDAAALFLTGRYLLQAATDVAGTAIALELATAASRHAWLRRSLRHSDRLGIDPWHHSIAELAQWRKFASELGLQLEMLTANPIDQLWLRGRPREHSPQIVDYPVHYAGESYQAKCAALVEHVREAGLQALLLADPEDVSWMLNVRAADEAVKTEVGDWHVVPTCTSRTLVRRDGTVVWFVDKERLTCEVAVRGDEFVSLAPPSTLVAVLRDAQSRGLVGVDLHRTPAVLALLLDEAGLCADDTAARHRWRKHAVEVQSARRVHVLDAVAVVRFMAWLIRTVSERIVSELEAAQQLEAFRAEHPTYKGPSMPSMAASGPSGAQPHYVPCRRTNRNINDHPIFWMDSGGQYAGGSTDNTITLAVGTPEARHIRAHTVVLQGFIALATARVPAGTHALHLDAIARQPLWHEGMDYAHATGHGVGNYLNIHEGPFLSREAGPLSTVPIEPGMIITNEPGYYVPDDFGLRIESHMVAVASRLAQFIEFETISRLPIDPKLVDFGRLSLSERRWLADYHHNVLEDVEALLDPRSAAWLRTIVQEFDQAASSAERMG